MLIPVQRESCLRLVAKLILRQSESDFLGRDQFGLVAAAGVVHRLVHPPWAAARGPHQDGRHGADDVRHDNFVMPARSRAPLS